VARARGSAGPGWGLRLLRGGTRELPAVPRRELQRQREAGSPRRRAAERLAHAASLRPLPALLRPLLLTRSLACPAQLPAPRRVTHLHAFPDGKDDFLWEAGVCVRGKINQTHTAPQKPRSRGWAGTAHCCTPAAAARCSPLEPAP